MLIEIRRANREHEWDVIWIEADDIRAVLPDDEPGQCILIVDNGLREEMLVAGAPEYLAPRINAHKSDALQVGESRIDGPDEKVKITPMPLQHAPVEPVKDLALELAACKKKCAEANIRVDQLEQQLEQMGERNLCLAQKADLLEHRNLYLANLAKDAEHYHEVMFLIVGHMARQVVNKRYEGDPSGFVRAIYNDVCSKLDERVGEVCFGYLERGFVGVLESLSEDRVSVRDYVRQQSKESGRPAFDPMMGKDDEG